MTPHVKRRRLILANSTRKNTKEPKKKQTLISTCIFIQRKILKVSCASPSRTKPNSGGEGHHIMTKLITHHPVHHIDKIHMCITKESSNQMKYDKKGSSCLNQ